jgi:hypothetical protein
VNVNQQVGVLGDRGFFDTFVKTTDPIAYDVSPTPVIEVEVAPATPPEEPSGEQKAA